MTLFSDDGRALWLAKINDLHFWTKIGKISTNNTSTESLYPLGYKYVHYNCHRPDLVWELWRTSFYGNAQSRRSIFSRWCHINKDGDLLKEDRVEKWKHGKLMTKSVWKTWNYIGIWKFSMVRCIVHKI